MPLEHIRTLLAAVAQPDDRIQPAIVRAQRIAQATGARVVVFHAVFEPYLSGRPFFDSPRLAKSRGALVAQRTKALERHAAALRRQGIDAITSVVWEEPPHEAIVRAAIRDDVDLVIAGTHQPRSGRAPALRYTDWELLRLCPHPLLIARTRSSADGPVVAALDPTHAHDKPAALDIALARQGATLADALGTSFDVVHCVPVGAYPLGPITVADRKRMGDRMQAKLRSTLKKSGASARKIHVLHGNIEDVLPGLLAKLDAQALVLGALSRRGLQRFVLGNTAEALIYDTPCDLMVVKPPGFKAPLGRSRKESVVVS